MSYLTTQPQLMSAAADNLAGIQTALAEANATFAGPTTGLAAAAGDEVSAAVTQLFRSYGLAYQEVVGEVTAFHDAFTRALAGSALAYVEAEVANAATSALNPIQSLLASVGSPSAAAVVPFPFVADIGIVMGGSGLPIPGAQYIANVLKYVLPAPLASLGLFTPEGLYPLTGIKSLPLNISVQQGLTILDQTIFNTLAADPLTKMTVLGYSQSSIIASLEMQNLLNNPLAPPPGQLSFTLLANQMNPNGGIFARFPGLSLPSLGIEFYGATPSNTQYPTNIFTIQYDGYADFPRYPINFLADLNAFAGIQFLHGTHPQLDPMNLPPGYNLVELPTSPNYYTNGGVTHYYMITTPNLPLLQPLRALPVLGGPLANLIEPNLRYLINLGYGDGNFGYSTSPADVPTPFGILPNINPVTFATEMFAASQQGGAAFMHDISQIGLPTAASLAQTGNSLQYSLPSLAAAPTGSPVNSFIDGLKAANTNIANTISNVAADSYAMLLPTADIVNGLLTTVPSYNVNLFLDGVEMMAGGDLLGGAYYALGAPIAADVGIATLAGGIQTLVLIQGVTSIIGDITSIAS